MTPAPKFIKCRLCDGTANFEFARQAADGDVIDYFICTNCGSLETEDPYWLTSYHPSGEGDLLNLDTYAAERTLRSRVSIYLIWRLVGFHMQREKLLDWGGGVGLLVRLLRDIGIDAHLYDKYASNHYASGFSMSMMEKYDMVTAFEVLEHLIKPSKELADLFDLQPTVVVASTMLFNGQGADWSYLGPAKSEHVFFYSERALRLIGNRFGYSVEILKTNIIIFYKNPISRFRIRIAAALTSRNYLSGVLFAVIRHKSYCDADNQAIRAMLQSD